MAKYGKNIKEPIKKPPKKEEKKGNKNETDTNKE